jgi:hypothetical protein
VYASNIQHVIENSSFCTLNKYPISTGLAEQIMPILRILCYNGSLVTWTVVSLTIAKYNPLIFYISGFALSYTANMFNLMILYDFCFLPTQFCYIIINIRKVESRVQIAALLLLFSCSCSITSMGNCLFVKALPSNGRVYLLIKNLLPSSDCCVFVCFEVATQQRLYTLQYKLNFYLMKSFIFWDITPCSQLKVNRRFGGIFCLHIQGRRISHVRTRMKTGRWNNMFPRNDSWLPSDYTTLYGWR